MIILAISTARRYASAVYAVVVCLSVRPSQASTVLKQLNIWSRKLCHTMAQGIQFSDSKDLCKNPSRSPPTGALNTGGVSYNRRFSTTNISLYLRNGARYGHGYYGTLIGTRMRSIEWRYFQWPWLTRPNYRNDPISVTNRSSSFLAQRFPSTYTTGVGREFGYLQNKIRVFPSGSFTQTLDLENFATARLSPHVLSTWAEGQYDKLVTGVGHQFITLTVHICVQRGGLEALRRAGLSAAAETCCNLALLIVVQNSNAEFKISAVRHVGPYRK